MKAFCLVVALACVSSHAGAQSTMFPPDPHIQTVTFSADRVVPLEAAAGYAIVVALSDSEHIETIVVGNSGAWQVTSNKRGDHVIVKPNAGAPSTDLVVTTDQRHYVFLLRLAAAPGAAPYMVRFAYPEFSNAMQPPAVKPPVATATYRLRGDRSLFPTSIADDGQRTSITWGKTSFPAILASDAHGQEAIVNGRMVNGVYVIEGIAARYVFRLGKAEAEAVRHVSKIKS